MSALLALVLLASASGGDGSLGVGLDVLPAAYTFAASRFDFAPDLRLTRCDRTSCRWSTGHGVDLVAYVSEWNLDVKRIEIDAAEPATLAAADALWFQKACSTVVALSLSGADLPEVKNITYSILSTGVRGDHRERDAGGIRFYGNANALGRTDDRRTHRRCGAFVRAQ